MSSADEIAEQLAIAPLCVCPGFLPPSEVRALRGAAEALDAGGALRPASVGRGGAKVERASIRGDRIAWLNDTEGGAFGTWLQHIDALREAINRRTFAGLFGWEGHVACYAPGAGYERHLDVFRDESARVLSSILYLNDAWDDAHGGHLRAWIGEGHEDVRPEGGTLVTFWSAELEHAVLPATRDRWAITGWFRTRRDDDALR